MRLNTQARSHRRRGSHSQPDAQYLSDVIDVHHHPRHQNLKQHTLYLDYNASKASELSSLEALNISVLSLGNFNPFPCRNVYQKRLDNHWQGEGLDSETLNDTQYKSSGLAMYHTRADQTGMEPELPYSQCVPLLP